MSVAEKIDRQPRPRAVTGARPYVSENLPHEFFKISISAVEAAVRFEKKFPQTEAPKKFEQPDNRLTPSAEEDQQTREGKS